MNTLYLYKIFIMFIAAFLSIVIYEYGKIFIIRLVEKKTIVKGNKIIDIIDPIGLILLVWMGIGWSKPVSVKYSNRNRKSLTILHISGMVVVISAAIIINVILNYFQSYYLVTIPGMFFVNFFLKQLQYYLVSIAVINILPVPPFAMSKILALYQPRIYFKIIQHETTIQMIFLLLIFMNVINGIVYSLNKIILSSIQLIF